MGDWAAVQDTEQNGNQSDDKKNNSNRKWGEGHNQEITPRAPETLDPPLPGSWQICQLHSTGDSWT
jgi:hypothetical protein